MVEVKKLLSRGWFAKELPPSFTTKKFATAVTASGAVLPRELRNARTDAKMCRHSLGRTRMSRRNLGIPNPIPFFNLSETISANWQSIKQRFDSSPISISRPVARGAYGRAVASKTDLDSVVSARAERRQRGGYLLRADVSEFYQSVYTHSIPWAIHTKPVAKANHGNSLFGNLLDQCVRNAQDKQTMGIPIGPDTSLIIAEVVLAQVDLRLAQRCSIRAGLRYYDDIEIAFSTLSEAEQALSELHQALAEYELQVNPRKTTIRELPVALDFPWVSPIRSFEFRTSTAAQRTDLIKYFDMAFELMSLHPDDSVMSYALSRLENEDIQQSNASIVQHLAFQGVAAQSNALPACLSVLLKLRQGYGNIIVHDVGEMLNEFIIRHASRGHDNEVAWALWAAMVFRQKLDDEATRLICEMEDSVVALLALDANSKGLLGSGFATARWEPFMDAGELYGEQWLLSYEAKVKGWLGSAGGANHIAADPVFNFLESSGVSFYQPVRGNVRWRRRGRKMATTSDYE